MPPDWSAVHRLALALVVGLLVLVGCADDTSTDASSTDASRTDAPGSSTPATTPETPSTAGPATGDAPDPALEANAVVERIVDGDTLVADVGGVRERVRLLGIDTPESVAEDRPDQCYGEEAGAALTALLPPGTEITLILDEEPRDQFDRLLAYVVRTSDQLFVNLDLLERGFAGVLIYQPNDHYAARFRAAARDAEAAGVGLWGVCGGPDVPLG